MKYAACFFENYRKLQTIAATRDKQEAGRVAATTIMELAVAHSAVAGYRRDRARREEPTPTVRPITTDYRFPASPQVVSRSARNLYML